MQREIRVYDDLAALARSAADHLIEEAKAAIHKWGTFAWLLSGGSTPKALYTLLAQPGISNQIEWQRVHLFWGDERCVHPDHAESNFKMVNETLLIHISIPKQNVHRIRAEQEPAKAAIDYEREVQRFFQLQRESDRGGGLFDLVLLGLGEDGHTASLFPGSPSLQEKKRWFVMAEHKQPPAPLVDRVTATLPLINSARQVTFLVSGEKKADRVREVLQAEANRSLPAQLVQPVSGKLLWLLDKPAALKIPAEMS